MANGSVSGGSREWSASNSTRAAERTAKRLSRGERGVYNLFRREGLSDTEARREIARIRRHAAATRGEEMPF